MQTSQAVSTVSPAIQPRPVSLKPAFWLRTLRRNPYVYSAVCKSRMAFSRHVLAATERKVFHENEALFSMSKSEWKHVTELRERGFTVLPDFFATDLVDRIFEQADHMFRTLQINMRHAYSVQNKVRESLDGLSYDELAASEKFIAVREPLINIPEMVGIAFHESILRIVGNFLDFIPPLYLATLVRDFPHERPLESCNFHKDTDDADSVQVFIYLVDIDDTRGPLVYVPGTNHYDVRSCRPRLSRDLGINANDGRLSDSEVEKHYPQSAWTRLRVKRGSVVMIHGNGLHKGPAWPHLGDRSNLPRTAIKIDIHGPKPGVDYSLKTNCLKRTDFERFSPLEKLFAHEVLR
jgi:hypothetical protein